MFLARQSLSADYVVTGACIAQASSALRRHVSYTARDRTPIIIVPHRERKYMIHRLRRFGLTVVDIYGDPMRDLRFGHAADTRTTVYKAGEPSVPRKKAAASAPEWLPDAIEAICALGYSKRKAEAVLAECDDCTSVKEAIVCALSKLNESPS